MDPGLRFEPTCWRFLRRSFKGVKSSAYCGCKAGERVADGGNNRRLMMGEVDGPGRLSVMSTSSGGGGRGSGTVEREGEE